MSRMDHGTRQSAGSVDFPPLDCNTVKSSYSQKLSTIIEMPKENSTLGSFRANSIGGPFNKRSTMEQPLEPGVIRFPEETNDSRSVGNNVSAKEHSLFENSFDPSKSRQRKQTVDQNSFSDR